MFELLGPESGVHGGGGRGRNRTEDYSGESAECMSSLSEEARTVRIFQPERGAGVRAAHLGRELAGRGHIPQIRFASRNLPP